MSAFRSGQAIRAISAAFVAVLAIIGAALAGLWVRANQPEAHFERGRVAVDAGDAVTVRREAEYLLKTSGFEPYGHLLKGTALARSGRFDDALQHLELASQFERTQTEASAVAAHCLYAQGRFLQAIAAADAALKREPSLLDARRWLAAAYYDLGAVSNAVEELEKISAQAPTDPRPDRLLGLIGKDGEHYTQAIEHYNESLKRDPAQVDREMILQELAESQIQLSRFQDAMITLQKATPSAATLTLEAQCLSGLGQINESRDRLLAALKLDSNFVSARLALGNQYLDGGDTEHSIEEFRKAAAVAPMNGKVHLQLSQAYRQAGRAAEADAELNQMMKIQELEREFSDLHDVAAKEPLDPDVRRRIGDLARQLEKPDLARMWYRAALGIEPMDHGSIAGLRALTDSGWQRARQGP